MYWIYNMKEKHADVVRNIWLADWANFALWHIDWYLSTITAFHFILFSSLLPFWRTCHFMSSMPQGQKPRCRCNWTAVLSTQRQCRLGRKPQDWWGKDGGGCHGNRRAPGITVNSLLGRLCRPLCLPKESMGFQLTLTFKLQLAT